MHENDGTCVSSLAVSKNLLSTIYLSCVYISLVDQRKALYILVHRMCPAISELFPFNHRFLNESSKPLKNQLLKNNTVVVGQFS